MKQLLTIPFIMIIGFCYGQIPSGYKKISNISWPKVDCYPTVSVPAFSKPPPYTVIGSIFIDTSDNKNTLLYVLTKDVCDSLKWMLIKKVDSIYFRNNTSKIL